MAQNDTKYVPTPNLSQLGPVYFGWIVCKLLIAKKKPTFLWAL